MSILFNALPQWICLDITIDINVDSFDIQGGMEGFTSKVSISFPKNLIKICFFGRIIMLEKQYRYYYEMKTIKT